MLRCGLSDTFSPEGCLVVNCCDDSFLTIMPVLLACLTACLRNNADNRLIVHVMAVEVRAESAVSGKGYGQIMFRLQMACNRG